MLTVLGGIQDHSLRLIHLERTRVLSCTKIVRHCILFHSAAKTVLDWGGWISSIFDKMKKGGGQNRRTLGTQLIQQKMNWDYSFQLMVKWHIIHHVKAVDGIFILLNCMKKHGRNPLHF